MDKDKALEAAVTQIERQFGKGSVMRIGDQPSARSSRSSLPARWRSTSRSASAASRAAASSRSTGPSRRARPRWSTTSSPRPSGWAAWRRSSTPSTPWTRSTPQAIGVDVDDLLVSQPDYGEQALEIAEMLVRSGALDVVAIDSVAALTPKAEIEGEMGDSFVGLQARLMSQALRKLAGTLNRSGTICVLHQPAAREDRRDVRQPRGHHRRAGRSSSTPRCASTSAASRPSRRAPRPSATGCA